MVLQEFNEGARNGFNCHPDGLSVAAIKGLTADLLGTGTAIPLQLDGQIMAQFEPHQTLARHGAGAALNSMGPEGPGGMA